jgi:hypothetical protein
MFWAICHGISQSVQEHPDQRCPTPYVFTIIQVEVSHDIDFYNVMDKLSIPVAVRSKASVCGRSLTRIVCSNPA